MPEAIRAALARSRTFGAIGLVSLLAVAACDDDSPTEPPGGTEVEEVISSVSAGGVTATVEPGTPESDPTAPTPEVTGSANVIPGGGAQYSISASEPFSEVFVFVEGRDGYYRLDVGSAQQNPGVFAQITDTNVILTLGEGLDLTNLSLSFAVGNGQGAGPASEEEVEVIDVGTGDVQVSVSWDQASDVDLYLVEPSGETIWYGDPTSESGGELDLDSNAACGSPDVRNENITWPEASPPSGEYTVRVNYWSSCGVEETNWVVTVRVAGEETRTFSGRFTGSGVGGDEDAGEVVTTFTN